MELRIGFGYSARQLFLVTQCQLLLMLVCFSLLFQHSAAQPISHLVKLEPAYAPFASSLCK